jgi:hypothetical protein
MLYRNPAAIQAAHPRTDPRQLGRLRVRREEKNLQVYLGYCRGFTGEEIRKIAENAGLEVVDYSDDGNWAVLRRASVSVTDEPNYACTIRKTAYKDP